MTKNEFLALLNKSLSPLASKDKEKTISYYQELIDDQLEDGKNENEVINALGNPNEIATKIKNEIIEKEKNIVQSEKEEKSSNKIGTMLAIVLGFPIWFSILAAIFAIIISVFASIYAILIALVASTFAICVASIVQIIASFYYFFINTTYAFSILGMGLVAFGLSILLYYATKHLIKYSIRFTIWFTKILIKAYHLMIGGQNVKEK